MKITFILNLQLWNSIQGTHERVRKSRGKPAISVRATEVLQLLYFVVSRASYQRGVSCSISFSRPTDGRLYFGKLLFTWLSLVMSMMVSFVLSFFPRDVLDEILNLIESVSEDFPSYFYRSFLLYLTLFFLLKLILAEYKSRNDVIFQRLLKYNVANT